MNIEETARVAHEINRAYCEAIGDSPQPAWEEAPAWQRQSAINGVNFHLAHPEAGPESGHGEWLKEKTRAGWVYGPCEDLLKKEHPCCVLYADLPAAQKTKNYLFRAVVHSLQFCPPSPNADSMNEPVQTHN